VSARAGAAKEKGKKTMFVEIHILQNFPPSNLNRDDVGQPKEADFGGVRRARISSQCLKRSIRYAGRAAGVPSVFERSTGVPLSARTKLMSKPLSARLQAAGKPEDAAEAVAVAVAEAYAGKLDEKRKGETAVLLYLSARELDGIAEKLIDRWEHAAPQAAARAPEGKAAKKAGKGEASVIDEIVKALIKETQTRTGAPDIALFGRMLADKPETNVDAACQVAHAISTHAVHKADIDYYTAMDELKVDEPGAGFLDVAYFNSACFYRYARIDVRLLTRNLGGDVELARRAVGAFIRASEAAVPSGKKNSHAQETRPSLVAAVVRTDDSQGWSLVNAFEKPVRTGTEAGLVAQSARELSAEFQDHLDSYGAQSVVACSAFARRQAREALSGRLGESVVGGDGERSALDVLVDAVQAALAKGA
jgi:CRISPR system Cascade subunit CasC